MTEKQRRDTRMKQSKGIQTRDKNGYELVGAFRINEKPVAGSAADIKKLAEQKGINKKKSHEDFVDGWEGAAKGLRKVLFERRFINLKKDKNYTKMVRKRLEK